MAMKHTPGPWMLEASGIRVLTAPGRSPIDMGFSGLTQEHDKANARLIVAAPELLAALKLAVSYAEAMERALNVSGQRNATLEDARAAIAKAEGENHES